MKLGTQFHTTLSSIEKVMTNNYPIYNYFVSSQKNSQQYSARHLNSMSSSSKREWNSSRKFKRMSWITLNDPVIFQLPFNYLFKTVKYYCYKQSDILFACCWSNEDDHAISLNLINCFTRICFKKYLFFRLKQSI